MLSRTAADLYWMSRYLERAENLARMLEVSYLLSLMPQAGRTDGRTELAMSLLAAGTLEDYQERHGKLDSQRMLHFFALDETNPDSIYCCLQAARANAHAVRGRITADMWENINATWLEMRNIANNGLGRYGISRFCEWVKERSHLFRGATSGTIMRNDAYSFIRLGTFLERADNTLRLLDSRYEMFGEESEEVSDKSARGYFQWSALLRALSSFEAFNEIYRNAPGAEQISEMLLLRADVPRSLRACIEELDQILSSLPNGNGRPAQRLAAELNARLRYTGIGEIFDSGLHLWLTDYIAHINHLGQTVHDSYLEVI
ncbi:alpha-E domain-containing protein [Pseudomonas sp. NPDC087346]|uniref:alpha-E domain-containing protein n=1 Tax=Pseudomonas sp. NPDC087346 TaxID=3364438 RepID=UPI00380B154E